MSAWYVFSLMGIYPVNPASGVYDIGSPRIQSAKIEMPNGKIFSIQTKNYTSENCYVQSVKLNGIAYSKWSITHQDMLAGGTMEIVLGSKPKKK